MYSLKTSMAHNKNEHPLLYPLINYISARSSLQILSLKKEYTYNSFANSYVNL